jgi:hypothetical protein
VRVGLCPLAVQTGGSVKAANRAAAPASGLKPHCPQDGNASATVRPLAATVRYLAATVRYLAATVGYRAATVRYNRRAGGIAAKAAAARQGEEAG